jgi:NAD(P)-dependent dehydrogenase (short-subunit alcohol dehydrogenase family)
VRCGSTHEANVTHVSQQRGHLDLLVLNASGPMERGGVTADLDDTMSMNRDARCAVVKAILPLFSPGSVIIVVTSHWAYLH